MSGLLDGFLPEFQFASHHQRVVNAAPERIWKALMELKSEEIPVLGELMWLRSLPARLSGRNAEVFAKGRSVMGLAKARTGPDGPSNAQELDSAPSSGSVVRESSSKGGGFFLKLAEDAGREIVLGTAGQFWKPGGGRKVRLPTALSFLELTDPDLVRVAVNFTIDAGPRGCTVRTETRVQAMCEDARRKFARFWRLIRPFSGLTRIFWLRAIERKASKEGNKDTQ